MGVIGYSDEYSTVDLLGGDKYYNGLARFIMNCSTPMTISIQGDWGTGKSTALNIIENKIKTENGAKTHFMHFNTWQYSKFGMEDDISLILMQRFCECLEEIAAVGKGDLKETVTNIFAGALSVVAEKVAGNKGVQVAEDAMKKLFGIDASFSKAKVVETLKAEIQKRINETVKEDERIIVLIDDLDRVSPMVAIELLEGMKNFLDCRRCVFVLAVDANVIYQGLQSKYGESFGKEKTQKYFDKIIQVPFNLPVAQYNLKKYVKQFLPENVSNEDKYLSVIKNLLGCNPRGIKRAFNLLELYELIMLDKLHSETDKLNLFAIILLQMKEEALYLTLVNAAKESNERVIELLKKEEYAALREAIGEDSKLESEEEQLADFAALLIDTSQVTVRNTTDGKGESGKEKELPVIVQDIICRCKENLLVDCMNSNTITITDDMGEKYCRFNISKGRINLIVYHRKDILWEDFSADEKYVVKKSDSHMTFVDIEKYDKEYIEDILTWVQVI